MALYAKKVLACGIAGLMLRGSTIFDACDATFACLRGRFFVC
jgi:hypothetical protein